MTLSAAKALHRTQLNISSNAVGHTPATKDALLVTCVPYWTMQKSKMLVHAMKHKTITVYQPWAPGLKVIYF